MDNLNPNGLECLEDFDHGKFGVLARKLQLLLATGQTERAVEEVRQFALETRRRPATMQSQLVDVVPVRLANALHLIGVQTVAAFLRCTDAQLMGVPNVGELAVLIRERVARELATGRLLEGLEEDQRQLAYDFGPPRRSIEIYLSGNK